MDKDLVEYIRANRNAYNRKAITEWLRTGGYTEEEIEAAWQQVLTEGTPPGQQMGTIEQTNAKEGGRVPVLISALVIVGIVLVVITSLGLSFASTDYSSGGRSAAALQSCVNFGSLALVALVAVSLWLLRRRGWSSDRIVGVVTTFAVIRYLIVAGSCLYGKMSPG